MFSKSKKCELWKSVTAFVKVEKRLFLQWYLFFHDSKQFLNYLSILENFSFSQIFEKCSTFKAHIFFVRSCKSNFFSGNFFIPILSTFRTKKRSLLRGERGEAHSSPLSNLRNEIFPGIPNPFRESGESLKLIPSKSNLT